MIALATPLPSGGQLRHLAMEALFFLSDSKKFKHLYSLLPHLLQEIAPFSYLVLAALMKEEGLCEGSSNYDRTQPSTLSPTSKQGNGSGPHLLSPST